MTKAREEDKIGVDNFNKIEQYLMLSIYRKKLLLYTCIKDDSTIKYLIEDVIYEAVSTENYWVNTY